MGKTITSKLEGILTHWWTNVTSANMDGFNNKIGALQRRSYGYRNFEYLSLKVMDWPAKNRSLKKANLSMDKV